MMFAAHSVCRGIKDALTIEPCVLASTIGIRIYNYVVTNSNAMTIQAASVPMELRCVLYPTLNYAEQTAGTRSTSIAEMVVFPALIHAMARVIRTRNFVITAVWCAITTNQFATSNTIPGHIIH